MNSRRWVVLTLVLCATIAGVLLPPKPGRTWFIGGRPWLESPWKANSLEQRRQNLVSGLTAASSNLVLSSWRDTVLASLSTRAGVATDEPVWLLKAHLSPQRLGALQHGVEIAWRAVRARATGIATVILVVPDSFPPLPELRTRALTRSSTIFPSATGGRACIAVIPVSATMLRQDETLEALGPCAYFAEFGNPGPAMEKWLAWQGFETAAVFDWDNAVHPGAFPVAGMQRHMFGGAPDGMPMSWTESVAGIQCREGQSRRCADALLKPSPALYANAAASDQASRSFRVWDYAGPVLNAFGDSQRGWFSDLVRTMGRERVRRFWTSSLPVETAFSDAMGVPLGDWTRDWVISRRGEIVPGPRISLEVTLGSLAVALVLSCVALFRASRRQVG
ncbi:MAG: hypothetical protein ABJD11_09895 [Gemmatimonadota bacterium]